METKHGFAEPAEAQRRDTALILFPRDCEGLERACPGGFWRLAGLGLLPAILAAFLLSVALGGFAFWMAGAWPGYHPSPIGLEASILSN